MYFLAASRYHRHSKGSRSVSGRLFPVSPEQRLFAVSPEKRLFRNSQNSILRCIRALKHSRAAHYQSSSSRNDSCDFPSKEKSLERYIVLLRHLPLYIKEQFLDITVKVCPRLKEETSRIIGEEVWKQGSKDSREQEL